ncbi:MAG: ATP-dependent DNA ligase, partial [Chloroflexi bacterium]|nr:ATP-dependent DNA ligase [Chloroflexota bacterium]
MLAKLADELPAGDGWLFEPKWDGFRAIVFRDGDRLYLQSRDLRPLDRYFPDLAAPLLAVLPERCVVDGEIVIATEDGLDFDALQLRLHPAASRVAKLA